MTGAKGGGFDLWHRENCPSRRFFLCSNPDIKWADIKAIFSPEDVRFAGKSCREVYASENPTPAEGGLGIVSPFHAPGEDGHSPMMVGGIRNRAFDPGAHEVCSKCGKRWPCPKPTPRPAEDEDALRDAALEEAIAAITALPRCPCGCGNLGPSEVVGAIRALKSKERR